MDSNYSPLGDSSPPRAVTPLPSHTPTLPPSPPRSSPSLSSTNSQSNMYLRPYGDPATDPRNSVAASTRSSMSSLMPPRSSSMSSLMPPDRSAWRGSVASSTYSTAGKGSTWRDSWLPEVEDDDDMHNPDKDDNGSICTARGFVNLGCLLIMVLILLALFVGYPVIEHFRNKVSWVPPSNSEMREQPLPDELGRVTPQDFAIFHLIDPDTPQDARTFTSMENGKEMQLVFSDEFNRPGRTFFPGDDPFWTAVDLHYWPTGNKEWYDPSYAYTENGHLVLKLDDKESHDLKYTGGMIQSWNQFCYTGGYLEVGVSLPGNARIPGLWPAVWTMGNLGRAGYGGTTEGMWPYTYDECDYGTFPNQTDKNGEPVMEAGMGDQGKDNALSWLPGLRLSACTCPGDSLHPGPKRGNGFVGRGAPEIDVFEALVNNYGSTPHGEVSLSGQWAPFNPGYRYINDTNTVQKFDDTAQFNNYRGGHLQQVSSVLAITNSDCYTNATGCYEKYGFEYQRGDDGYITWLSTGRKTWTLRQGAFAPNEVARVGQRLISVEPMYIIMNLGMSESFGAVDYDGLERLMPVEMWVDYVRVYQDPDHINIGCNPPDYPTASYIEKIRPAFDIANITSWDQLTKYMAENNGVDLKKPRNRLYDGC